MSVKAMNWVFEHSRATGHAYVLMLAIADRANDEGDDSWESIETLAKKARQSKRTAHRSIRHLESNCATCRKGQDCGIEHLGELEVRRGAGPFGRNIYRIRFEASLPIFDEPGAPTAPPAVPNLGGAKLAPHEATPPSESPSINADQGCHVMTPEGCQHVTPGGCRSYGTEGVPLLAHSTSCTSGTPITNTAEGDLSKLGEPTVDAPSGFARVGELAPKAMVDIARLSRAPNDDGNYRVIAKLAFDLLERGWWQAAGQRFVINSEMTLVDALKDECGRLRIERADADVVYRAASSEWFKYRNPAIAGRTKTREMVTA
jgi:hypothetical protein